MNATTVLVIGREGQVARALADLKAGHAYHCCPRTEADLASRSSLEAAVAHHRPTVVVNAGAYTAVDRAEQEEATAFLVNAEGPGHLAAICRESGIPLVHLSTDYVFDGKATTPYPVDHPTAPINAYGRSKTAGEEAVRSAIREHVIVRGSWLFSERGQNFVTTMLRLARERPELGIVDDQHGNPTYVGDLAAAIDTIVTRCISPGERSPWGTYHVANSGVATWYAMACEIFRVASRFGHPVPTVKPITTAAYPTPARRPAYSVLDTSLAAERFGVSLPSWQDGVARCVSNLLAEEREIR